MPTYIERTVWDIALPNSRVRDTEAIKEAFAEQGLDVAEVEHEPFMWTWVLCDDGSLWLHDQSHGGGGVFQLQST